MTFLTFLIEIKMVTFLLQFLNNFNCIIYRQFVIHVENLKCAQIKIYLHTNIYHVFDSNRFIHTDEHQSNP